MKTNKNVVRLTESQLKAMIAESVKKVLNEMDFNTSYNFDFCGDFREGYAWVKHNGKWNWIDTEGNLLFPNQWFDDCGNFYEGYAAVKHNGKNNWIDKEGNLLFPNQWFDKCHSFHDGYALVYINRKWLHVDKSGNLYKKGRDIASHDKTIKMLPLGINIKNL